MSQNVQRALDACERIDPKSFEFAHAVLTGLASEQKEIPSRFLYDARGSDLFEEITKLPEYYLTRTEVAILERYANEIAADVQPDSVLIEFGSGSSLKTQILLRAISKLAAYVPVDISPSALSDAEGRLKERFPKLNVLPVVGDFSKPITLPASLDHKCRIGFFPGSTIGNMGREAAVSVLQGMAATLGQGARLIIGADLKKDVKRMVSAYADSAGVTAEFNFNLLKRINRELRGSFDPKAFTHKATYNRELGRMESHLHAKHDLTVSVLGRQFTFLAGEGLHIENSYKYDLDGFSKLAKDAGWATGNVWMDDEKLFSVFELIHTQKVAL